MRNKKKEQELLVHYVESFFKDQIRQAKINGYAIAYYRSLRGYFKHANMLTDIKQQEFTANDYKVWEMVLTKIKPGHNAAESGGLYFRYEDFEDICSRRAFYKTRRKLIDLELLIETPFKHYLILNPVYAIKLYTPLPSQKISPEE